MGDQNAGERRRQPLSEEQIDQIAEAAADKAIQKLTNHVYKEVGRSVLSKLFYVAGAATVGVYLLLKSRGIIQ